MRILARLPDMAPSMRRTAAALIGAGVLVGLVITLARPGELWTVLAGVDSRPLLLVVGATIAVLFLRGLALWVLLDVLGHQTSPGRALSTYVATVAVNTVVPGGQAGGAPINGYLVSQSSGADYEDGIAAVAGVAALSNAAIVVFGLAGTASLLVTTTGANGTVTLAAVGTVLFGLAALALAGLWRVRDRVETVTATLITRAGRVAAVIPGIGSPEPDAVDRSVRRVGDAVARFRDGTPRQFAMLAVLSGLAHALTIAALWISFLAVGEPVSIGVVMAVIPAGVATAVVPTPGGFGSIEVALAGLLAAGTSASVPIATTAVVVYQSATTVPALVVGGCILAVMLSVGTVDRERLGSLWQNG